MSTRGEAGGVRRRHHGTFFCSLCRAPRVHRVPPWRHAIAAPGPIFREGKNGGISDLSYGSPWQDGMAYSHGVVVSVLERRWAVNRVSQGQFLGTPHCRLDGMIPL